MTEIARNNFVLPHNKYTEMILDKTIQCSVAALCVGNRFHVAYRDDVSKVPNSIKLI